MSFHLNKQPKTIHRVCRGHAVGVWPLILRHNLQLSVDPLAGIFTKPTKKIGNPLHGKSKAEVLCTSLQ